MNITILNKPTDGTFTLTYGGESIMVNWSATQEQIENAIDLLYNTVTTFANIETRNLYSQANYIDDPKYYKEGL